MTTNQLVWKPRASEAKVVPSHQSRAGLGVFACSRRAADRRRLADWKAAATFNPELRDEFAAAIVTLVRQWAPVLPPGVALTVPPAGASAAAGTPYAALALAQEAARRLELPFVDVIQRRDLKKWHGRHYAMAQDDFDCMPIDPSIHVLIVADDAITSGSTMQRSLRAIRGRGVAAFGFSFAGW